MKDKFFRALVAEQSENEIFKRSIKELPIAGLPPGELLIRVEYSSLNYKDALSATGNKGVTKNYPHVPGIDAAGVIEESSSNQFQKGDQVIVTSYDLGMNTSGGFGSYIRVPSAWALKLPAGLTLKESMIIGTAGFTAGMAVFHILKNTNPEKGEVLVTGASGGLGTIAVAILSRLGYSVAAGTGKTEADQFLKLLGARTIISREELLADKDRPLLKPRWSAVIDTVGGDILANAVKSVQPLGIVTSCGNALSASLNLTVFPFILRGISLIGIDSQNCPMDHRRHIWQMLATDWKISFPEALYKIVDLETLDEKIDLILKGKLTGRVVVKHQNN